MDKRKASRRPRLLWPVIAVAALGGCKEKQEEPRRAEVQKYPERVITLTPSATRLVVALGVLDRLVATDQFSDSPAAVKSLPKVGDFLAPNVEVIAKLRPDLVICDDVQSKAKESLESLGIHVLSIKMHSVADVDRALDRMSRVLGARERGLAVRNAITGAIEDARTRAEHRESSPRVLWVMDRQPGALAEVVAAGPGSFASELLEIVGARNAVIGSVRYPKLSREALIKIDPDRVIDASGAAEQSIAAWGDRWNAVAAPTGLATPGPELVDAIAKVERLIFESSGTKADPTP